MNKFSIFHTSFCGSTLLAAMLSKSIDTYSEPYWSHQIRFELPNREQSYILNNHPDNSLIKYSSVYCYASSHLPYKKVFLYRKLKSHMHKLLLNDGGVLSSTTKFNLDVMKNHHHPTLHQYPIPKSLSEYCAYLWVDRILWMKDDSEVYWIDSDDFFNNPKLISETVCNYFNVNYTPLDIPFHAKLAGFNHTDNPINVNELDHSNIPLVNPKDTKILQFTNNGYFNEIINNIQKTFPAIESKYIE